MCRSTLRHLAILIVLSLPVLSPRADAADRDAPKPRELKMLRVLLVTDTGSDLGPSVTHDREHVKRVLEDQVPEDRRKIDCLEGSKVTLENIRKYYRDLETGPDEALLFFYAGHGAIDPKLGHCLQPQMGDTPLIPRDEVRKAMEKKGAGLVVLLTDCCSTRLKAKPPVIDRAPIKGEMHPVVRCLLFQHRGLVDVTAAEDGKGAWGGEQGGVFTGSLVKLLKRDVKALDSDGDGFVSWKEFFPQLSKETEKEFKDFAAQARANNEHVSEKTQRPRSFSLAEGKTYAVISLRNNSGKPVRYRYRWTGETDWKDGTIEEMGKVVHETAVGEDGKLPEFEVEADSGTDKGKATLKAAKWSGAGRPAYKDGLEYNISAK